MIYCQYHDGQLIVLYDSNFPLNFALQSASPLSGHPPHPPLIAVQGDQIPAQPSKSLCMKLFT